MPIESQKKPCPECGQLAGWWSGIATKKSMIFHKPNGNIQEERIVESKRKHCANCDAEVTECISHVEV
jgi:hypothetical protein